MVAATLVAEGQRTAVKTAGTIAQHPPTLFRYLPDNYNLLKHTTLCCLLFLVPISLLGQATEFEVPNGLMAEQDEAEFYIGSSHTSATSGVTYFYLQQTHQGIDIDGAIATVGRKASGDAELYASRWYENISERIETPAPIYSLAEIKNRISEVEGFPINQRSAQLKTKPLWILDGEHLKFVIELRYRKDSDHWRIFADANGNIVRRQNLAIQCNHDHRGIFKHHKIVKSEYCPPAFEPAGDSYLVYPLGTASPAHAPQSVVTDPADLLASPYGWHDTDGVEGAEFFNTQGNNTRVQEDTLALNGGGFRPSGGEDLAFLYSHDPEDSDFRQMSAALTNLFYWININHDILYHHGFDEAAGNFQLNNYGNASSGAGDPIIGDAFDGSGLNNAVFIPGPDGTESRLETYLWTGSIFDSEILMGDPANPIARIPAVQNQFSLASQLSRVGSVFGNAVQVVDQNGGTLACDANQILNPSLLSGRLAIVGRGECFFIAKAANVDQLGASALIVIQNLPASPFPMGGSDGTLTIPSVMISKNAGEELRAILNDNPNIPLTLQTRPAEIARGASLDNTVITHEYAHGLTTRLTGGKQTITCLLNFEQMSEGWSDYFGLMFTTDWGAAQATDRYGIGAYLVGDVVEGPGIRVYPYSNDFLFNPLTYDDLPTLQIPHGIGELWSAILWDLTWNMIAQDGIATDLYQGVGGNTNALKLIIEALKIQPCSPGFVDARDALIRAATNLGWEKYHYAIWSAFARRGLGEQADQGRVDSPVDGESSFNIPANFETILENFELIPEQNQVGILWATAQEYGGGTFVVERSGGGTSNMMIAREDAAYISPEARSYQAADENIIQNEWHIYELYLEEVDGGRRFLAKDSVIIIPTEDLAVYPVPARNELFITAGNLAQPISDIVIYDNRGVLVLQDLEQLAPFRSRRISVDQLPAGLYYLQSRAGDEVFWRKFSVL